MIKQILILLLLCSTAYAENVVVCQTGNDDGLQVKKYIQSVDIAPYSDPKNIIDPDLSLLIGVDKKYWKCENGGVVEMTQGEKDALDLAEINADIQSNRTSSKNYFNETQARALIEILISEINILRSNDGLSDRTIQQLKTAIDNKIDSGDVD